MAAGYACMAEGEPHAARWLLTSLDPPATITACDEDFPLMMIPVLAANLDADPDRLYDAIKRHLDRETARAAKAARDGAAAGPQNGPGQPPPPGMIESNDGSPASDSSTSSDISTARSELAGVFDAATADDRRLGITADALGGDL